MAVIGEAFVEVKPDAKGFGPDVEKSVLSQVKGIAAKAAVIMGGAFAVRGGIQFFGGALQEAEEARKTMALTEAVIKSTGGTAGVTADSLSNLAGRLSNISAVDDEVIQSAGNVLLTFTNVKNQVGAGNDVFDQAAEAALNMSAALGTDLQGSTLQLGKALNDPIKGITALSRAGVSFTAEQKEQIKTLVASGDTLGAQKVILAELNKEFAGAAEAAAPPLDRLKVTYDNLKESLGTAVVPGLTAALPGIQTAIDGLTPTFTALGDTLGKALGAIAPVLTKALGPIATTFADTFGGLIEGLSPILDALAGAIGEAFAGLGPILTNVIGPVASVVGDVLAPVIQSVGAILGQIGAALQPAFAALAPVVVQLGEAIGGSLGTVLEAIVPVIGDLMAALGPVVTALVKALAPVLPILGDALGKVASVLAGTLGKALEAISPMFDVIADVMMQLAPVIGQIAELLATALGDALEALAPVIGALLPPFGEIASVLVEALAPILPDIADLLVKLLDAFMPLLDAITPLLDLVAPLADLFGDVLATALKAIAPLLTTIADLLTGALGVALDAITPVIKVFADLIKGVVDFLTQVFKGNWSEVWQTIKDVATEVWDAITGAVRRGWDFITGIFGKIGSFLSDTWSNAWNGLTSIASNVLDKVVGFVTGLPGRIASAVSGLWDSLGNGFKAVVNSIIGLWNKLDFGLGPWKIPDWVPIVGGKSFGIKDIFPDIPLLAYGDVVTRPTLGIFGEAGPEVVLPLSNRKRLIELLVQALGAGGGVPMFARGAIFGGVGTVPTTGDMSANLGAWRQLVEALLRVAEIDPSAIEAGGIAVPDEDAWERLTDAARAAGVELEKVADRVTIPLGAFIDAAGLQKVPGSNLGDEYTVTATRPTLPPITDPFFIQSFDGLPWAQLAMLAERPPQAELLALRSFMAALAPPTTGQEFYEGLVYDRGSGRVLGWRRSDEADDNPLLPRPPQGWRVPALLKDPDLSDVDERALIDGMIAQVSGRAKPLILSRELMDQIRAAQDQAGGLVRATIADFALTDWGVQGRTKDVHWQGVHALEAIPGARTQLWGDGSAVGLLPGNVLVRFTVEPPGGATAAPSTPLDVGAQVDEARRAWNWLTKTGVLRSAVAARDVKADNMQPLLALLPYWVRLSVLAAGYLPGSFPAADRARLDLPSFLSRVARLGDGGIVQPRDGGTLAFLAERGQAEAILPLPSGLLDSLTANAGAPTAVDRSFRIERATFDLGNVRDPYRVPSALWSEAESIVWKNGG